MFVFSQKFDELFERRHLGCCIVAMPLQIGPLPEDAPMPGRSHEGRLRPASSDCCVGSSNRGRMKISTLCPDMRKPTSTFDRRGTGGRRVSTNSPMTFSQRRCSDSLSINQVPSSERGAPRSAADIARRQARNPLRCDRSSIQHATVPWLQNPRSRSSMKTSLRCDSKLISKRRILSLPPITRLPALMSYGDDRDLDRLNRVNYPEWKIAVIRPRVEALNLAPDSGKAQIRSTVRSTSSVKAAPNPASASS